MAGGETGNEMLGTNMLGGSMLGGGPSGGSGGGASSGIVGDWFTGVDMLGGGPASGDGGGGGGGGVDAYGGRIQGDASVSGDIGILSIHPVEAAASGQASVSGTLGVPSWAGAGSSTGNAEVEAVLRYAPPQAIPFEETFDPVEDFPHTDGGHWNHDKWFPDARILQGYNGTEAVVDVQGGRGRIRTAGGYGSPSLFARTASRHQDAGDVDFTFTHEVEAGFGGSYIFGFRSDGAWASDTSVHYAIRPLNGYCIMRRNDDAYLYLMDNGSVTVVAQVEDSLPALNTGIVERVRVNLVGPRIQVRFWADGDVEPANWDIDEVRPVGEAPSAGVFTWGTSVAFGGSTSTPYVTQAFLDDISIQRIETPLEGTSSGESSLEAEVSLPTMFSVDPIEGSSSVEADADVHLLSGGEIHGESEVVAELLAHHPLSGEIAGSSSVADPHLDAYAYEALISDCTSEVEADPDVEYEIAVTVAGLASVTADVTNLVEIEISISGSSTVTVEAETHMLPGGLIEGSSEVSFHLRYIDDIVRMLVDTSAGGSTVSSTLSATVTLWANPVGQASFTSALLTYWKPLAPVTIQGSSSLVGQFEIYTIPPDPIEGSSEVEAHLEGDYQYTAEIESTSTVTLNIPMDVELFFLPGQIDGHATVVGHEFIIAPHDLQIDQIEGSSEFVSVGTGYLVLNLLRGMRAETTSTLTDTATDLYTGTHFTQAILGMPVVIGPYQTFLIMGSSEVESNLFINEGGQANCNSRVSGLANLMREVFMEAETTGSRVDYYAPGTLPGQTPSDRSHMEYPEYFRPIPPTYVLDQIAPKEWPYHESTAGHRAKMEPCGSRFLWVDFWPRGELAPQLIQGNSGVGRYFPNGRDVHPLAHPENEGVSGARWPRDPGWFVENISMNLMGLFARTSEVDDYYSKNDNEPIFEEDEQGVFVPVLDEEGNLIYNDREWGDMARTQREAGQLWHPQISSHRFHGRCGTSLDVDLFVELKNALYANPTGYAQVVADFIILQYRSITVLGNVARMVDRDISVTGGTARSPNVRAPLTLRPPGVGRNLDPVRSGRTLYT